MDRAAWPPPGVVQRVLDHKELITLVRDTGEGEDVSKHLARYLVVRSAGLVEAVRDDVADHYCRIVGHARVHNRVASGLRGGLGARPNQLVSFLQTFDADWALELSDWFDNDGSDHAANLGVLVGARRKIAHGDGDSVRVSPSIQGAESAIAIANWLVKRFDPR